MHVLSTKTGTPFIVWPKRNKFFWGEKKKESNHWDEKYLKIQIQSLHSVEDNYDVYNGHCKTNVIEPTECI